MTAQMDNMDILTACMFGLIHVAYISNVKGSECYN